MKKILAILLTACLALALAACGETEEPETAVPETATEEETTVATTVFTIPQSIRTELTTPAAAPSARGNPVWSLNFGPYYLDGMDPELGSPLSEEQIRAALRAVAPYCDTIRTFGVTGELNKLYKIAKEEFGLRVIAGCWIGGGYNDAQVQDELAALAGIAGNGWADILLVGSEGLFRRDYSAWQLIGWMDTLRGMLRRPLPVGTSDTAGALLGEKNLIANSDIVCYTYYPYFSGADISRAAEDFAQMHRKMRAAAGDKPLICGETGWPDDGEPVGGAVPGAENAARYFDEIYAYSRENGLEVCYFEAITEPWKGKYGAAERSFGLLGSDLRPKAHYSRALADIAAQ